MPREEESANCRDMAQALAERYSSLSLKDCLQWRDERRSEAIAGEPLTDLPLMADQPRSFVVPPGVEVGGQ